MTTLGGVVGMANVGGFNAHAAIAQVIAMTAIDLNHKYRCVVLEAGVWHGIL